MGQTNLGAGKPLVIDYRQENPTDELLPEPPLLSSEGWKGIQLTIFEQPALETAEHEHTTHAIAATWEIETRSSASDASGERWLDGKRQWEPRTGGEIAMIPAGVSHRCNWRTSVQFAVLSLAPEYLEAIARDWCARVELVPRFMLEGDAFLSGIFRSLRAEMRAGEIGSELFVDSLKTALAIHLIRHYCTRSPRNFPSAGSLSADRLKLVTDYIQAHLQENLQLSQIAAIAQISPYHFLRLFKQSIGLTPHQYILRTRLERAKTLLQRKTSGIDEIALEVGFCDRSHLTRAFKQAYGLTPKQFRQAIAQ